MAAGGAFPKIDLHTHILPPEWPDLESRFGGGRWLSMQRDLDEAGACCGARLFCEGRHFRDVDLNCFDHAVRLEEMDGTGVTMQALSTVPVMFSYWARPEQAEVLTRVINDHIADVCREHPGRFVGLGTLPMQDPDHACRELERCVGDLGMRGIEIGSHIELADGREWNLNEPEVFVVLEAAAQLGAAVFVHPWDMMGSEQMRKYWLPWLVGMPAETSRAICSVIFGGVLERLPSLRIAFAHGGGSFPGTIGRIEHGFNVRPDLCAIDNQINPRDYLARDGSPARFYVDSLVHDETALRRLLEVFGEDRIAMGSDYPFPLGEARPGQLIESMGELSDSTKRRLLAGTAEEFLGIGRVADTISGVSEASTIARESHALELDRNDPLGPARERFLLPHRGGEPFIYLAGNSLGCQPREARGLLERELEDWAELAVLGHHHGRDPWLPYHEWFRGPLSRLVGGCRTRWWR